MNFLVISVIGFVLLMFLVGVIVSKKVKDSDDFFLGGRNVPEFLIVATLIASEVGGGIMLGSVGLAYKLGFGAMWYVAPVAVGLMLFGITLSKKIKIESDKNGYISMFDWLTFRFDNYKPLKILGGIVMLTGFIGALASQFVGMGTALTSFTGMNMQTAIVVGGLVIIIYASLGGLLSVMWTDLLQAIVFIFGMVVLLPLLLKQPEVGGFTGIFANAPRGFFDIVNVGTGKWRITMLVTMMIAPFVRQYYYQRMYASKTPKIAQRSIFIQAGLILIITVWSCLVGICVYMINPGLANPETAMPWVVSATLPPVVAALVLGAITACVMSSADTFVNAASLTFVTDIYGSIKGNQSKEKSLKMARYSSFAIGGLALLIALFSSSVISAILNAWAILGGGLFVPMIVSYLYKPSTKQGVLWSMASGLIVTLLVKLSGERLVVPSIICGIVVSFIALVIVSATTKEKDIKVKS